jgi:hypothetical protein
MAFRNEFQKIETLANNVASRVAKIEQLEKGKSLFEKSLKGKASTHGVTGHEAKMFFGDLKEVAALAKAAKTSVAQLVKVKNDVSKKYEEKKITSANAIIQMNKAIIISENNDTLFESAFKKLKSRWNKVIDAVCAVVKSKATEVNTLVSLPSFDLHDIKNSAAQETQYFNARDNVLRRLKLEIDNYDVRTKGLNEDYGWLEKDPTRLGRERATDRNSSIANMRALIARNQEEGGSLCSEQGLLKNVILNIQMEIAITKIEHEKNGMWAQVRKYFTFFPPITESSLMRAYVNTLSVLPPVMLGLVSQQEIDAAVSAALNKTNTVGLARKI